MGKVCTHLQKEEFRFRFYTVLNSCQARWSGWRGWGRGSMRCSSVFAQHVQDLVQSLGPRNKTNSKWMEGLHITAQTTKWRNKGWVSPPWSWRLYECNPQNTGNKNKDRQMLLHLTCKQQRGPAQAKARWCPTEEGKDPNRFIEGMASAYEKVHNRTCYHRNFPEDLSEKVKWWRWGKADTCFLLEGLEAGVAVVGNSVGIHPKLKKRSATS